MAIRKVHIHLDGHGDFYAPAAQLDLALALGREKLLSYVVDVYVGVDPSRYDRAYWDTYHTIILAVLAVDCGIITHDPEYGS